jgi:secreted Zn-dependent insulinase-like peptidase
MQYISYILEHGGAGSLISLLKKNGLANRIEAGVSIPGRGFAFLTIKVDLTIEGWVSLEKVILHVFQVRQTRIWYFICWNWVH